MIALKTVECADKDVLWNIFQKYTYEMSAYCGYEMGADGNYIYRYFDAYFEEKNRTAYFIYDDETLIGFAMVNDYSCLDDAIDHAMAEFTVFPNYRGKGFAGKAVQQIFSIHPGRWEIKFSERNRPASSFWRTATVQYKPHVTAFGEYETVLSFRV